MPHISATPVPSSNFSASTEPRLVLQLGVAPKTLLQLTLISSSSSFAVSRPVSNELDLGIQSSSQSYSLFFIRWQVLVYPTWWFNIPAILKGFFDRCFIPGVGFRYDKVCRCNPLSSRPAFTSSPNGRPLCTQPSTTLHHIHVCEQHGQNRPPILSVCHTCSKHYLQHGLRK